LKMSSAVFSVTLLISILFIKPAIKPAD
jgi:hypothetical protein